MKSAFTVGSLLLSVGGLSISDDADQNRAMPIQEEVSLNKDLNSKYYDPKTHQVKVVSYYFDKTFNKDMSYSWSYYDAFKAKQAQQKTVEKKNSHYYNPKTHDVKVISYYYDKTYKTDMSYSYNYYDAAKAKQAQALKKNSHYYNPKTHEVKVVSYYYDKTYKTDMSYSYSYIDKS